MGEKYAQEFGPGSGSTKLFLLGGLQPPVPPCIPRGSASRALRRSWYQDLGTKILVPRSLYQDPGTKILGTKILGADGLIKNDFFVGPLEFTKV